MRLRSIIIAGLMLAPVSASALEAIPAGPPAAATAAPAASSIDGLRVAAIAAGAVVGVVVVEYLTAGAATPVLFGGGPAMAMEPVGAASAGYSLFEVVTVAAGAFVGGEVGNWLYGK